MTAPAHEDRAHAVLGASSAARWMACPGSIRLSEGQPNSSSKYADEGTAAHQLAERCLSRGANADQLVGTVEVVRNQPWEVTEEMAEAVQVFLDQVRGATDSKDTLLIEQRFDLSSIHPGMFGTNDACVVSPSRKTLFVFDYKHGRGHAVEAVGNPQLRYYGLGALLMQMGSTPIERLVLTIVQPRAAHKDGPIRTEVISVVDLLDWTGALKAAAVRTEDPNAPVKAGDWCLFCRAAGVCPALRDKALEAAMADFATASITVPADPGVLSTEQVARLLDSADLIDTWLAAVRAHALHQAERGIPIPGYKLVPKRATRKWRDNAQFAALSGYDIYLPPKMMSPAQVEKMLPKDKRPALDALVEKVSSGTNLVPDSDVRKEKPASALADFVGLL